MCFLPMITWVRQLPISQLRLFQLHDSPREHLDSKPKGEGKKSFEPGEKVHLSLNLWIFPCMKGFYFKCALGCQQVLCNWSSILGVKWLNIIPKEDLASEKYRSLASLDKACKSASGCTRLAWGNCSFINKNTDPCCCWPALAASSWFKFLTHKPWVTFLLQGLKYLLFF